LDKKFILSAKEGFNRREEINGRSLYAAHQVYRTRPVREARFEAHRRYIDLQYLWSGEEWIGLSPLHRLAGDISYNRKTDVKFFKFTGDSSVLLMRAGMVAVFFPEDAHAPGIACGRNGLVAKTVVKVLIPE
jgi:biofilm protein TabA